MSSLKWMVLFGFLLSFVAGCSTPDKSSVPMKREHPRAIKTYDEEPDIIWDLMPEAMDRAGLIYTASDRHMKVVTGHTPKTELEKEELIQAYIDRIASERTRVEVVTRRTLKINEEPREWGNRVLVALDELLLETDREEYEEDVY